MRYKIIALDLDGTLTNSSKIITPRTKEALYEYQEQGGRIVLASGRPTQGIVPLAEELELSEYGGYILAFNGGRIINCNTKEIMYDKTLEKSIVKELEDLTREFKTNIMTYQGDYIYTLDAKEPFVNEEYRITGMPLREVENLTAELTTPVNKCLMTAEPVYLEQVEKKVKQIMGNRINVYRSQPFFLELVPQNIDKAESLDKLLKQLHLTRENLIACGDGYNDLSMIRYAGLGVAMENGEEGVKKHADYIAPSNDNDGIAYILEKFIFQAA